MCLLHPLCLPPCFLPNLRLADEEIFGTGTAAGWAVRETHPTGSGPEGDDKEREGRDQGYIVVCRSLGAASLTAVPRTNKPRAVFRLLLFSRLAAHCPNRRVARVSPNIVWRGAGARIPYTCRVGVLWIRLRTFGSPAVSLSQVTRSERLLGTS